MIEEIRLIGTTETDGTLTVNADRSVAGLLHAIQWVDGDLADGVDAVVSVQGHDNMATVLSTLTDANSDALIYPRAPVHDLAGVGLTLDGTRVAFDCPLVVGTPRLVVASGGDAKTGGCILFVEV